MDDALRREPFRLFFPLAFVLGAAAVSHWVLFSVGAIDHYLGLFHAVTQMQGFMMAFACGFLMTALPKRTGTPPATWVEIGAIAALLPVVSLAALLDRLAIAETAYGAALLVLTAFAVRRFVSRKAGRRPPASFAAVPVGLLSGLVGAALMVSATRGAPGWTLSLGRALVLEGVFLCLVLGIGSFFFALALRGAPPPDLGGSPRDRVAALGYAAAALTILAGLVIQDAGHARAGLLVRAGAVVAALIGSGALRPPSRPGLNRRLVWTAGLAVPLGLVTAAVFPEHRVAAMHILYVGGFGLLALSVAAHVTLGHGGFAAQQEGKPWPVAAFGALFLAAAVLRATAVTAPDHYFTWLGVAASVWLAGAVVWAVYLLPKMWTFPEAG